MGSQARCAYPGGQRSEELWVDDRGTRLHSSVRSECYVRPGSTIKRTILLAGSSVGDGAHLEDCIVGHGNDVRAGERIRGVTLVRGATYEVRRAASSSDLHRSH
jgi:NDP-sugar pyrophosphorylase family protein